MVELIGIMCLLAAIAAWSLNRTIINPISILLFVWSVIILFSGSGLYSIGDVDDRVYVIIIIGLLSFIAGAILGERKRIYVLQLDKYSSAYHNFDFNYRLLTIIMVIALGLLLYQSVQAIALLRRGFNLAYIRRLLFAYEENEMRTSSVIVMLQKFFIDPTVALLTCFIPIEVLRRRQGEAKHQLLLMGSIICLILSILSSGGRLNIVALSVYFVTCHVFMNKRTLQDDEQQANKRNRIGVLVLLVIILIYITFRITINRGGENFDLIRHIFIYLGAPIRFLNYNIDKIHKIYGSYHAYGLSSFYGFFYLFFFVLRFFTGAYPDFLLEVHDLSVTSLQTAVNLGDGIRINAFATLFYQPYLDGGVIGVLIIMFLFGFAAGSAYASARKYGNLYGLLFYLMFEYQILFSMVRFWFTQVTHAVWAILILLIVVSLPKQTTE